jgi:hypothetical protein
MLGMPIKQTPPKTGIIASTAPAHNWIKQETDDTRFKDLRLARRCTKLLGMMSAGLGQSIPFACQDWASTKAAYRFLDNDQMDEAQILAGHFRATRDRLAQFGQTVLLLHDTCEFSFQRKKDSQLGLIGYASFGRDRLDQLKHFTVRGLLMHSTLALTLDGLPLGLAAIKFWTRQQFKGCNALKRKVNPTRVPIEEKESFRWLENLRQSTALLADPSAGVHIGDRESDIYELFCLAEELGTRFLVRTCVDRLAEDDQHTIAALMQDAPVRSRHRIHARNKQGQDYSVELELKYAQMQVLPPAGKRKDYPPLTLTVIHAVERGTPTGREPIVWKLLTNLPVNSRQDAIEKLNWYALRWKIEVFHKILKSGCKIEESKLRTSERLVKLIALYCLIGWRIFWLTMQFRANPEQPAETVFTKLEIKLLDQLKGPPHPDSPPCLGHYLLKLAQLGGYLARASDPPPGNKIFWRGLTRLHDIHLGYLLAKGDVGN